MNDSVTTICIDDDGPDRQGQYWLIAVLCLAAALLLPLGFDAPLTWNPDSADFSPLLPGLVLAGLIGCYAAFRALWGRYRWRRFGRSQLLIPEPGPHPGQRLCLTVRNTQGFAVRGEYRLQLRFVETFFQRDHETPAARNPRDNIRWQSAWQRLPADSDLAAGLRACFDLPERSSLEGCIEELAPIKLKSSLSLNLPGLRRVYAYNRVPDELRWELQVEAGCAGIDYRARFHIPQASRALSGKASKRGRRKR